MTNEAFNTITNLTHYCSGCKLFNDCEYKKKFHVTMCSKFTDTDSPYEKGFEMGIRRAINIIDEYAKDANFDTLETLLAIEGKLSKYVEKDDEE